MTHRVFASPNRGTPRSDAGAIDPDPLPPTAGCTSGLRQTIFVDGGTSVLIAEQNGSICLPFGTIQQALDFMGVPVDAADQARFFNILVTAGVYDEDLVVPALREVVIQPFGRSGVVLGPGLRTVTWTSPSGVATGGVLGLQIDVTGDVIISDGGTAAINFVILEDGMCDAFDATGHVTGLLLALFREWEFDGTVTGALTFLAEARQTNFTEAVSVFAIEAAARCRFDENVTVVLPPSDSGISGYDHCAFAFERVFTGPAESLAPDGFTQYSIEREDLVLAGGATLSRRDDPMLRTVDVDLTAGPFTVDLPNRVIFVTAIPAAGETVFLPLLAGASPKPGDLVIIKDQAGTAGTDNITVDGNGNTIDGVATQLIAANFGSLSFMFTGTEWSIV